MAEILRPDIPFPWKPASLTTVPAVPILGPGAASCAFIHRSSPMIQTNAFLNRFSSHTFMLLQ